MTPQTPDVRYVKGEEYRPDRKYLSASNWVFLALKVFGYNVLGYLLIVIPLAILFAVFAFVAGARAAP